MYIRRHIRRHTRTHKYIQTRTHGLNSASGWVTHFGPRSDGLPGVTEDGVLVQRRPSRQTPTETFSQVRWTPCPCTRLPVHGSSGVVEEETGVGVRPYVPAGASGRPHHRPSPTGPRRPDTARVAGRAALTGVGDVGEVSDGGGPSCGPVKWSSDETGRGETGRGFTDREGYVLGVSDPGEGPRDSPPPLLSPPRRPRDTHTRPLSPPVGPLPLGTRSDDQSPGFRRGGVTKGYPSPSALGPSPPERCLGPPTPTTGPGYGSFRGGVRPDCGGSLEDHVPT